MGMYGVVSGLKCTSGSWARIDAGMSNAASLIRWSRRMRAASLGTDAAVWDVWDGMVLVSGIDFLDAVVCGSGGHIMYDLLVLCTFLNGWPEHPARRLQVRGSE